MVTKRDAWRRQKNSALKRDIDFQFSFKDWCQWWETNLGSNWFVLRGCKSGQFVMARNKDQGPYADWNVRCATVADNHVEHNLIRPKPKKTRRKRLTPQQVINIYLALGSYSAIAQHYKVDQHRVHCIKCRKYYRKVIENGLRPGPAR